MFAFQNLERYTSCHSPPRITYKHARSENRSFGSGLSPNTTSNRTSAKRKTFPDRLSIYSVDTSPVKAQPEETNVDENTDPQDGSRTIEQEKAENVKEERTSVQSTPTHHQTEPVEAQDVTDTLTQPTPTNTMTVLFPQTARSTTPADSPAHSPQPVERTRKRKSKGKDTSLHEPNHKRHKSSSQMPVGVHEGEDASTDDPKPLGVKEIQTLDSWPVASYQRSEDMVRSTLLHRLSTLQFIASHFHPPSAYAIIRLTTSLDSPAHCCLAFSAFNYPSAGSLADSISTPEARSRLPPREMARPSRHSPGLRVHRGSRGHEGRNGKKVGLQMSKRLWRRMGSVEEDLAGGR